MPCATPARLYEPSELLNGVNQRMEDLAVGIRIVLYAGVYNVEDVSLNVDQMCDRAYMALKNHQRQVLRSLRLL